MIEKKNICLVIPSLSVGGMERVMCELANYLAKRNDIAVKIVLYGRNPQIFYKLSKNVSIHRTEIVYEGNFRFVFAMKTLFYLRRTVRSLEPSAVLSFGEFWNSFVLISLFGIDSPIYISDRCQPSKSLGKKHDFLRKFLYPSAQGIIVQTQTAEEIYKRMLRKGNINVIANPIRLILANSAIQRQKIVLCVARLINSKNLDRLITIFSDLNAIDWKLVLVGRNALGQDTMTVLQNLVKTLNLSERVVFEGEQENVDWYYRTSSIFAFTSSSEGFPNAIGEAMSAGLPVVAYNCIAGPADLIDDGVSGYLVDVFDDLTFRNRLKFLIDNAELREKMGANGAKKIEGYYSQEKIGNEFARVLLSK